MPDSLQVLFENLYIDILIIEDNVFINNEKRSGRLSKNGDHSYKNERINNI